MIKIFNVILFVLFCLQLVIMTSCKQKQCIIDIDVPGTNNKTIKREIDNCNGKTVVKEQEFTKDSTGKYLADGFCKFFYPNSQLKSLSYFVKGTKLGEAKNYYENGNIERKEFMMDKYPYGPQYLYSENGKWDSIKYYDLEGKIWLTIHYNRKTDLIKINGSLVHLMIDHKHPNFSSVSLDSFLFVMVEVASIDQLKTKLEMTIQNQKKEVIFNSTIDKFSPLYNTTFTSLKHKFSKKGNYICSFRTTLLDSLSGRNLYTDSGSLPINVY